MPLRSQQAWCLVVAICTVVFYILLSAYTADLANPRPIFGAFFLATVTACIPPCAMTFTRSQPRKWAYFQLQQ